MKATTVRTHSSPSSITIHLHHYQPYAFNIGHRLSHSLTITQLFGISTTITGALAVSGNSSVTPSITHPVKVSTTSPHDFDECTSTPCTEGTPSRSELAKQINAAAHGLDQFYVSIGDTTACHNSTFSSERRLFFNSCYPHEDGILSARGRHVRSPITKNMEDTCVLATFLDFDCTVEGNIVAELESDDSDDDHSWDESGSFCLFDHHVTDLIQAEEIEFSSLKWTCGPNIDLDWNNPLNITVYYPSHSDTTDDSGENDQLISARSVDAVRDHVRVFPADGTNCNNALDRDSDRQVYNDCHPFAKPFFSIRAQITHGKGKSKLDGSQPCSVLVFSDEKCHKNGAEVIHLDNTLELGVCHEVSLHHKGDNTAIAGHSWKWVCGQDIDNCINPGYDSETESNTGKAIKSTVKTVTATSTASLACSLTTEAAHSTSVIASVVTMKPVTHTITSVFTKTQLRVHTKLLTSIATDVSTMRHTVTKPFSTTYKVCDAVATSRS
ncbi:unnamed protein product [Aureobasidium uvarum]|uniref:Uncharacterized protein n=1 Tax=Aureobasidium uvarum TaxID=2773716 RepID=A0A9N8KHU9_9PEZI|nr:unnamed protein product [Aureobasidium uvarum]